MSAQGVHKLGVRIRPPPLAGELNLPESGNGIPDLLDEMQVGLDWLLTQQRSDGAVYRKLSGRQWPNEKAPDEDQQPRYVYGMTTPETAKFAAVMAMAGRVYQPLLPKQAERYKKYIGGFSRAGIFLPVIFFYSNRIYARGEKIII